MALGPMTMGVRRDTLRRVPDDPLRHRHRSDSAGGLPDMARLFLGPERQEGEGGDRDRLAASPGRKVRPVMGSATFTYPSVLDI